jgi:hypothetical protein
LHPKAALKNQEMFLKFFVQYSFVSFHPFQVQLVDLIAQNPFISYEVLADKLNKNRTTVMRNIQKLKELGILKRVGLKKIQLLGGEWLTAIIVRLAETMRSAALYKPDVQVAPVCILWPEHDRHWETISPRLQSELPELLVLGDTFRKIASGLESGCAV